MSLKGQVVKGGVIEAIVYIAVGLVEFLKIKYFIQFAGSDFNGYYTFIEQLMAYMFLAEASLGAGIVFTLYRPIAKNDLDKISSIYYGGKKIYKTVSLFMMALLAIMMIFAPLAISDARHLMEIEAAIFIIGLSNLLGYLFYSRIFLCVSSAYREKYIHYLLSNVIRILASIAAIVAVANYKSLLAVALVIFISRVFQEAVFYFMTKKRYGFIRKTSNIDTSAAKMTGDLFVHQIGSLVSRSIDSVIIMVVKGPFLVSVYSSYNYVLFFLTSIFNRFSTNAVHMFGNIFVGSDQSRSLRAFNKYAVFCLLAANFLAISFYVGIVPFVGIWIGEEEYVLSNLPVALFASGLFLAVNYAPMITAISANGLFKESKYFSLFASAVNLGLSMALIGSMGLSGVLLATVVSYFVSTAFRSRLISQKVFVKLRPMHWFFVYTIGYLLFLAQILLINLVFKDFMFGVNGIMAWIGHMTVFTLGYAVLLLVILAVLRPDFRGLVVAKIRPGGKKQNS